MPNPESSVGPVVATIVILAVIVLGGLYFWSQRSSGTTPTNSYGAPSTVETSTTSTPTYDVNAHINAS